MRNYYSNFYKGLIVVILISIVNTGYTQNVRINELMAVNVNTLADSNGDYSDWIELFNFSNTTVNLEGWALTDDMQDAQKWKFPKLYIGSNQYLLIFASGKDTLLSNGEIHCNFKLSGDGEYLALRDSKGSIVSEISPAYPAMHEDQSIGWLLNGWVTFSTPSPKAANDANSDVELPAPVFSQSHGFYIEPIHVNMNAQLDNTTIYYTTDGSEPSINDKKYTSSLFIAATTVLRAKSFTANGSSSKTTTCSYFFVNDIIHQSNAPTGYPVNWGPYTALPGNAIADYEMDPELMADEAVAIKVKEALESIPTISIVTDKANFFNNVIDEDKGGIYMYTGAPISETTYTEGRGWERPVSFEYFDKDSISIQVNCGIRIQGGHSRRPEKLPKHSFLLVFNSDYGPTKLNYTMFEEEEVPSYDNLILRAGFGNSWIHHSSSERNRSMYQRDIWTKDTQRDMGHHSSNSTYAHVYINGIYWGMYAPSERMDKEYAAKYMGGKEEDWDVIKDYADPSDGTIDAWNQMMKMANAGLKNNDDYQRFQGNNPDGTPNPEIEAMADVVNLADYMLINFYGANTDWDHHNWAAMRNRAEPDKGFKFFCWDNEHLMDGLNDNNVTEDNANCPSHVFRRLMQNETYQRLFADRVQKYCYNNGELTPALTEARWNKRTEQIKAAVYAESARWGDYRRDVHPYQTAGPFALYNVEDHWLPQQEYMRNTYFPKRTDILISQLRNANMFPNTDAPTLYINNDPIVSNMIAKGDNLSMTTTKGTVYYTTNGTDPANWAESAGGSETTIIADNADKRVLVPKTNIGTSWYAVANFDDSSWQVCSGSPGGVGYEKSSGYERFISLDVANEMRDGSDPGTSCYIRIPFQLTQNKLSAVSALLLKVLYDDAFVAYINGTEVARANITGNVTWNTAAPGNHEADLPESFDISSFVNRLKVGENILAIHGLNQNTTSSDFIINAEMIGSDQPANTTVSENAILYSGAIEMEQSAHIIARTFNNGEWSAANKQFLIVPDDYHDLKITEIHYNPLGEDDSDGSEFEFIELKNTGTSTLSLNGLQFIAGIEYEFTSESQLGPQEFIVLASNKVNFYSRYQFAAFDEYKGKLDNNGEWLVLSTATNDTIAAFRYNDGGDWPASPDGEGFSLVPTGFNPDNDQANPVDWRASYLIGGSPGADDIKPDDETIAEQLMETGNNLVLSHNYPNPFANVTYIDYQIPSDAFVQLSIYNMTGQQIVTLVNENQREGLYQVEWSGGDQRSQKVPGGIYFYRLLVQNSSISYVNTKKMLLLR